MTDYSSGMLTAKLPIPVRKPWPYFSVAQTGADNTGKTETADAINRAIAQVPAGGGDVIIPRGKYLIDAVNKSVVMRPNMRLVLEDYAVLQAQTNKSYAYQVVRADGASGSVIQGGLGSMILGDRDTHDYVPITRPDGTVSDALSTHEWGHCIVVRGTSHFSVIDLWCEGGTGDGLSTGARNVDNVRGDEPCDDIFIRGLISTRNRRQGISVGRATNVGIQKCEIYNIGGTGPGAGIDIEPTSAQGDWEASAVVIEDCYIHNNQSANVLMFTGPAGTSPVTNIIVRRCRLEESNLGVQAVGASNYWILGCQINHHRATGIVLGKYSSDSHVHENTLGFNYLKQGEVDRPDFEYTGWARKLTKDILIANDPAPNDIGHNYYL